MWKHVSYSGLKLVFQQLKKGPKNSRNYKSEENIMDPEGVKTCFTYMLGYLRSNPGEDPTPSVTSSVVAGDWSPPSRTTLPLVRVQLVWEYLFSSKL